MALFGKTKKETPKATTKPTNVSVNMGGHADILRHARITEKATMHMSSGVYAFDISPSATKRDIIRAVSLLYKVVPRKVAIVAVPKKQVRNARTGREGIKKGGRKAYVYLKKGESLTIS